LKCDGTRAETRFSLSAKQTSPIKSAVASVQSTADRRGVRISGSNTGYTTFRGSVKSTGYPLNSPVSPSLPLPCVTVCHHVSTGLYLYCSRTLNREGVGLKVIHTRNLDFVSCRLCYDADRRVDITDVSKESSAVMKHSSLYFGTFTP